MTAELAHEARRAMIGDPLDWVVRPDVSDYLNDEAMIRKLIEEKQLSLAENLELKERERNLSEQCHALELNNRENELRLKELKRNSLCAFLLSVGAVVLVSIGTNLVVNAADRLPGAGLIGAGIILEVVAFVLARVGSA